MRPDHEAGESQGERHDTGSMSHKAGFMSHEPRDAVRRRPGPGPRLSEQRSIPILMQHRPLHGDTPIYRHLRQPAAPAAAAVVAVVAVAGAGAATSRNVGDGRVGRL